MRSLILITASLLLTVLLGEGLLRLAGYAPRTLIANPKFSGNTWAKQDARLGWTNRQGTFRSDEYGNVMMNFGPTGRRASWSAQTKPARQTVYVIGGSFTQGYGVMDADTYVYHLNELFPDVMFENFGVGAYSTYQSLLRLNQLLADAGPGHAPDLVIYGHIGDHEQRNVATYRWITSLTDSAGHYLVPPHVTMSNGELVEHPQHIVREWPLETHSTFLTLLHDAALRLRYLDRSSQRRAVTDELIRQMQMAAVDSGTRLLVVLLNNVKDGLIPYLEKHHITYLDCVNPAFETDPSYRVGGEGHPSALQHDQWANCIREFLDNSLSVEVFPGKTRSSTGKHLEFRVTPQLKPCRNRNGNRGTAVIACHADVPPPLPRHAC